MSEDIRKEKPKRKYKPRKPKESEKLQDPPKNVEEAIARIEENRIINNDDVSEVPTTAEVGGLSPAAQKWKAYLQLQQLTPEKFLEKYKTHRYRFLVEEILAFENNSKKT